MRNRKEQNGFTLIELIVALAIFTVLSVGVIGLVSFIFKGSSQQANLLSDTDQGRRLAFMITSEIRNATTSNTGAFAIDTAAAQQLIFYSNVDSDSGIERVRYYLSSGKMYRGVTQPTGSPAVYNTANEASLAIQNNVANGSTPLFYYYADTYNGNTDTPLTQPVNQTAVKFIKLNLRIYNKAGVVNTSYYTVTAGAAVRNLKTNLAN